MRNKFAALALAAVMLTQAGLCAFADEAKSTTGPWTSSKNTVWTVASFPLRVVSGGAGILLGALNSGAHGILKTEEKYAQNTFGKAHENALLVPAGIVGTVVAVPMGFAEGAPAGAVSGAKYGYHIWDAF